MNHINNSCLTKQNNVFILEWDEPFEHELIIYLIRYAVF